MGQATVRVTLTNACELVMARLANLAKILWLFLTFGEGALKPL